MEILTLGATEQPLECDICSRGHISKDCRVRDKCRKCLEPGQMAHNCPNPPRAWEVVNQGPNSVGVSSASFDPTPAQICPEMHTTTEMAKYR